MRKSGSLLLTLAVLCLALLGEGAPAFAQAPAIGRVEALVGTAVVTRQATGAAGPLTVGDELFEADSFGHIIEALRERGFSTDEITQAALVVHRQPRGGELRR